MILYLDTSALVKKYFEFACFDKRLLEAATTEGLKTFPAEICLPRLPRLPNGIKFWLLFHRG